MQSAARCQEEKGEMPGNKYVWRDAKKESVIMPLKINIKSLDEVEETQRGLYKKDGDGFVLDIDGYEDPSTVKKALDSERTIRKQEEQKRKDFEAKLKKLENVDPDKYAELIEAEEERQQETAVRKGDWEKLQAQLTEKHARELAEKEKVIADQKKRIETTILDGSVTSAIAKHKGVHELLFGTVRSRMRLVEDNGKYIEQVVDKDGNVLLTQESGKTSNMSADELVQSLKSDEIYQRAFDASVPSGGGAAGGGGGDDHKTVSKGTVTRQDMASGRVDVDALAKRQITVSD